MGKRSGFKRLPQDAYDTPYSAVPPLLPHIKNIAGYREPCAGAGQLIKWLGCAGHHCIEAADIKPRRKFINGYPIYKRDALHVDRYDPCNSNLVITNPPWQKEVLLPLIDKFIAKASAWLLLPADFKHTHYAAPYMKRCKKVVSIGRVKWIADSKHSGKDNCAWYLFQPRKCTTRFYGRVKNEPASG